MMANDSYAFHKIIKKKIFCNKLVKKMIKRVDGSTKCMQNEITEEANCFK